MAKLYRQGNECQLRNYFLDRFSMPKGPPFQTRPLIAKMTKLAADLAVDLKTIHLSRTEQGSTGQGILLTHKQRRRQDRVVFLHGAGNDCLYPQLLLFRHLLGAGYSILSLDLDGHGLGGDTYLDLGKGSSPLEDLFSDSDPLGLAGLRIHLAGHSLGGALILDYLARKRPTQVASAAAIAVPISLEQLKIALVGEWLGALRPNFWQQLRSYSLPELLPAVGPFKRHLYPIRIRRQEATVNSSDYIKPIGELFSRLNLLERVSSIKIPLLLAYAERDFLAAIAQGAALEKACPGASLVRLKRETHLTCLFSNSLFRALTHWFESHSTLSR